MDFSSFDAYEQFLNTTLETWSTPQHMAVAVAMVERWMPQYEAFSKTEKWGDTPALRQTLNAAWELLQSRVQKPGDLPSAEELDELTQLVRDNTPHMDDFDAPAALATCVMLGEALRCSTTNDGAGAAVQAMLSGFEAVAPHWESEEATESRRWRRAVVQRELRKQLKLIEQIGAIEHFDEATTRALRETLNDKSLVGEVASKAKTTSAAKDTSGRTLISNQTAFEQYRRMMEADLKNSNDWWQKAYAPSSAEWAMMIVAAWASRYSRRRQTIDGTYGPLADTIAQQALIVRQQTLDGAQTAALDWEVDLLEMLELTLQSPHGGIDVNSLDAPHSYGPSLRALWAQAQQLGLSSVEAWNHILSWSRHRPTAWQEADWSKKQKHATTTSDLSDYFNTALVWQSTGDPEYPWKSTLDSASHRVRLNDFPDAFMYTLFINNAAAGNFNDWPESWYR